LRLFIYKRVKKINNLEDNALNISLQDILLTNALSGSLKPENFNANQQQNLNIFNFNNTGDTPDMSELLIQELIKVSIAELFKNAITELMETLQLKPAQNDKKTVNFNSKPQATTEVDTANKTPDELFNIIRKNCAGLGQAKGNSLDWLSATIFDGFDNRTPELEKEIYTNILENFDELAAISTELNGQVLLTEKNRDGYIEMAKIICKDQPDLLQSNIDRINLGYEQEQAINAARKARPQTSAPRFGPC